MRHAALSQGVPRKFVGGSSFLRQQFVDMFYHCFCWMVPYSCTETVDQTGVSKGNIPVQSILIFFSVLACISISMRTQSITEYHTPT